MADVCVEKDCLEFFGKSMGELLAPMHKLQSMGIDADGIKREVFNRMNPKTQQELYKMYESDEQVGMIIGGICDNFFSSCKNLSDNDKIQSYIYKIALDVFYDRRDNISILDYGAGNASYSLHLYFQGFKNITICDIAHKYFNFLRFLCKKYDVGLNFLELINDNCLIDKYDYIICSEVLEHVLEPEQVLFHLKGHLKDDGIMYLSTFFDDMNGKDPTHLVKNTQRYNNFGSWLNVISRVGLKPVIYDNNGIPKGFQINKGDM